MKITHISDAPSYVALLHTDVDTWRLQGLEAGITDNFWIGLSIYAPGGIAESSPTKSETMYVVLDGELTLESGGEVNVLKKHDSVRFAPGEVRQLTNKTNQPATLLVTIAYPKG